jgi:hypothetical protein
VRQPHVWHAVQPVAGCGPLSVRRLARAPCAAPIVIKLPCAVQACKGTVCGANHVCCEGGTPLCQPGNGGRCCTSGSELCGSGGCCNIFGALPVCYAHGAQGVGLCCPAGHVGCGSSTCCGGQTFCNPLALSGQVRGEQAPDVLRSVYSDKPAGAPPRAEQTQAPMEKSSRAPGLLCSHVQGQCCAAGSTVCGTIGCCSGGTPVCNQEANNGTGLCCPEAIEGYSSPCGDTCCSGDPMLGLGSWGGQNPKHLLLL